MIKNYKQFNESLRNKMTSKSEEDILKAIEKDGAEEVLLTAIRDDDRWLFDFALENGADLNKEMYKGRTYGNLALGDASIYGRYQMSKTLIEKGVKVTLGIRNSLVEHTYGPGGKRMLTLLDKHLDSNESLRDQMKGKSEEDIIKSLEGLSDEQKIIEIIYNQLPFDLLPPGDLVIDGDVGFIDSIDILPDNLTVNGVLDCTSSDLTKLPNNLKVYGDFFCAYNKLTELPDDLIVTGDFYCHDNPLPLDIEKPPGVQGEFINKIIKTKH